VGAVARVAPSTVRWPGLLAAGAVSALAWLAPTHADPQARQAIALAACTVVLWATSAMHPGAAGVLCLILVTLTGWPRGTHLVYWPLIGLV
jgi:di/tricarboxylate transporter